MRCILSYCLISLNEFLASSCFNLASDNKSIALCWFWLSDLRLSTYETRSSLYFFMFGLRRSIPCARYALNRPLKSVLYIFSKIHLELLRYFNSAIDFLALTNCCKALLSLRWIFVSELFLSVSYSRNLFAWFWVFMLIKHIQFAKSMSTFFNSIGCELRA